MALERFSEWIKDIYQQPIVRRIYKICLILIFFGIWFLPHILSGISTTSHIVLYFLITLLFSIEVIETKLYDIEASVEAGNEAYISSDEAYDFISSKFSDIDDCKICMTNYAGVSRSTRDTLDEAYKCDAKIFLLLKHPNNTVNNNQSKQVQQSIELMYHYYKKYNNLFVRFYHTQSSLKGIKVSEEYIGLGWYTFEDRAGEDINVWGSQNPTIIFSSSIDKNFDVVNEWYMKVFSNLWNDSESMLEMCDSGTESYRNWVESDGQKKQWVEEMSEGQPHHRDYFLCQ